MQLRNEQRCRQWSACSFGCRAGQPFTVWPQYKVGETSWRVIVVDRDKNKRWTATWNCCADHTKRLEEFAQELAQGEIDTEEATFNYWTRMNR